MTCESLFSRNINISKMLSAEFLPNMLSAIDSFLSINKFTGYCI